jgi:hypothetical protein
MCRGAQTSQTMISCLDHQCAFRSGWEGSSGGDLGWGFVLFGLNNTETNAKQTQKQMPNKQGNT